MSPRRERFLWLRILLSAACLGLIIAIGAHGQNSNNHGSAAPAVGAQAKKAAPPGRPNGEKFKPDQVLVRFRKGVKGSAIAAAHGKMGAHVLRTYSRIEGLQLVHIPPSMTVEDAIHKYEKNHDVLYVEPDYYVQAVSIPNDPNFGDLWGLNNTGQSGGTVDADIDAPEAWDYTTGSSSVVVAVIDSGVDYNHPDLAANIWSNPLDCNSNGVDDDGDGYVDDCHGIDTINNDSDPVDDNGHGTHVSGIIGAVGNNSVGVTGVNWNVSIMACKFLDASGSGAISGAIACLDYVATMKDQGVNLLATNNSWEGGSFSQAMLDAIEAQRQRGILFFVAAGNGGGDGIGDNNDAIAHYPSNYYASNLVAVASTARNDARSSFSNYGRRTVHLGAPGSAILSTVPAVNNLSECTPGNLYCSLNGTSMATPYVTGVAALLKAYYPELDWKAIKNRILSGGDAITSMNATTISQKRLNAFGALTCTNSIVLSRLRPIGSSVYGAVGTPVTLSALHINCGSPNGRLRVSVAPVGVTVDLLDDGFGADEEAGDGIYSGQFTPRGTGTYTLTFPGSDVVTLQVAPMHPYEYEAATYNYRTITGTSLALADESTATITSPFPIPFGGGSYTNVYVGDDGVISFSNAYTFWNNYTIPTTNVLTLVAPFWDDLVPVTGGNHNVFWDVLGSAPDRELVIEWRDVPCFGCFSTETAKFQVVFFENKSDILFNYADLYFTASVGAPHNYAGSATVGVQISTTSGRQYSYNTASLSDGSSIRWWTRSATVTPANLNLGEELVGTSSDSQTVTVTNNGGAPLTLSGIDISGSSAGDFSKISECPLSPSTLDAGANCTINVTFTPSAAGPRRAMLSVTHDAPGSPNHVTLTGLGVGLSLSETNLTFPAQNVGSGSAPQTVTVTNHGTDPVSIFDLEVTGVNSGDFAPGGDCPLAPATLGGGATCTISVVFTPSAAGARSALLLMSHDGGASPASVTLNGTGQ
jgi:subtilisin family serine protease